MGIPPRRTQDYNIEKERLLFKPINAIHPPTKTGGFLALSAVRIGVQRVPKKIEGVPTLHTMPLLGVRARSGDRENDLLKASWMQQLH